MSVSLSNVRIACVSDKYIRIYICTVEFVPPSIVRAACAARSWCVESSFIFVAVSYVCDLLVRTKSSETFLLKRAEFINGL